MKLMNTVRLAVSVAMITATAALAQTNDIDALKQEAEHGNANAQYNLGFLYYECRADLCRPGIGNFFSIIEAEKWFQLAAEKGHAEAQFRLGVMYERDRGMSDTDMFAVKQDCAKSLKWYQLAAEQGYIEAQLELVAKHAFGRCVPTDRTKAVKWYRMAAERGDASGQFALGNSYEHGLGVPQDFVTAHMWFNLSAANGDERAPESRSELAESMTASDISKAHAMAREWMAAQPRD